MASTSSREAAACPASMAARPASTTPPTQQWPHLWQQPWAGILIPTVQVPGLAGPVLLVPGVRQCADSGFGLDSAVRASFGAATADGGLPDAFASASGSGSHGRADPGATASVQADLQERPAPDEHKQLSSPCPSSHSSRRCRRSKRRGDPERPSRLRHTTALSCTDAPCVQPVLLHPGHHAQSAFITARQSRAS